MNPESITIPTPRGVFGARAAGPSAGPLVLCLHGFPDDASTFDDLLTRLAAAGFRAVAPYGRGYAPSPLANPDGTAFGKDLLDVFAADAVAVADALSPGRPVCLLGHDNGAFAVYHALRLAPERWARAVTLTAAHPAVVFGNSARSPAQMWRLRYVFLFQVPRLAEWWTARGDFAYVEALWRRWAAPGWTPPAAHLRQVKATLRASGLAPLLHYRSGGLAPDNRPWPPIATPTLYLAGARDGCVSPDMAAGQERFFSGPFRSETVADAGHFLHLEQPEAVGREVLAWLR